MKKHRIPILLLTLVLLLCACGKEPSLSARPSAGDLPESSEAASVQTGELQDSEPETEEPLSIPSQPPEQRPAVVFPELGEITPAGDYAAAVNQLAGQLRSPDPILLENGELSGGGEIPGGEIGAEDPGVPEPVPGVEKLQKICTDEAYLYLLDSRNLTILEAAGKKTRQLCSVPVETEAEAMLTGLFLGKNRVGVVYLCRDFAEDESGNWTDRSSTHLVVYDTKDKSAPVKLADTALSGSCLDACCIGGKVYLVTNCYLWALDSSGAPESMIPTLTAEGKTFPVPAEKLYLCPNPNNTAFTLTAALSLKDGGLEDCLAFTDASNGFFADREALYLARTVWKDGSSEPYSDGGFTVVDYASSGCTEIRRLRLEGGLSLDGACMMEGIQSGSDGLALRESAVCAATTVHTVSCSVYTDESQSRSAVRWDENPWEQRVTVLDTGLKERGSLEGFTEDSGLCTARFTGNLCLLCPLAPETPGWVVDLSDPEAPALAAGLEGDLSDRCLSIFGRNRLLSLGPGSREDLVLTMYDLKKLPELRETQRLSLSEYSSSPIFSNGAALYLDPESGLIGFPVDREAAADYGYCLCRWTGKAFTRLGELRLDYLPEDARALLIGDLLYLCSPGTVYVTDPEAGKVLAVVTNAEG